MGRESHICIYKNDPKINVYTNKHPSAHFFWPLPTFQKPKMAAKVVYLYIQKFICIYKNDPDFLKITTYHVHILPHQSLSDQS